MTKHEQTLLAVLATIMQMSDHAQKLGGATSIAGVAALHKMQVSIQKNGPRLAKIVQDIKAADAA